MLERGYPEREITALDALKSGSLAVRLSAVIWGLGCLVRRQFVKGACYLLDRKSVV